MNHNHEKNLNSEDYAELFQIYDIVKPKDVPRVFSEIITYLEEGYKLALKKDQNKKPLEITTHTTLLKDLHLMAENMLTQAAGSTSLYIEEHKEHIHLVPLHDFFSANGGFENVAIDLNILLNIMRNYANAQNVEQYKSYADFIEMLEIGISNIGNNKATVIDPDLKALII